MVEEVMPAYAYELCRNIGNDSTGYIVVTTLWLDSYDRYLITKYQRELQAEDLKKANSTRKAMEECSSESTINVIYWHVTDDATSYIRIWTPTSGDDVASLVFWELITGGSIDAFALIMVTAGN